MKIQATPVTGAIAALLFGLAASAQLSLGGTGCPGAQTSVLGTLTVVSGDMLRFGQAFAFKSNLTPELLSRLKLRVFADPVVDRRSTRRHHASP